MAIYLYQAHLLWLNCIAEIAVELSGWLQQHRGNLGSAWSLILFMLLLPLPLVVLWCTQMQRCIYTECLQTSCGKSFCALDYSIYTLFGRAWQKATYITWPVKSFYTKVERKCLYGLIGTPGPGINYKKCQQTSLHTGHNLNILCIYKHKTDDIMLMSNKTVQINFQEDKKKHQMLTNDKKKKKWYIENIFF